MIYLVGIGSVHHFPMVPVPDQVRMCGRLISDFEAAAAGGAHRTKGSGS
jgi:hypothetical protein